MHKPDKKESRKKEEKEEEKEEEEEEKVMGVGDSNRWMIHPSFNMVLDKKRLLSN